jgi:DNA-binding MarR family transcriptional regulator
MSSTNSAKTHRATLIEHLEHLGQASSTETALFHQAAAAAYGLGITDMKALSLLTQEGSRTAGQLKTALHLTTGAVTNLIDRLEKRHFVMREADPDDRRKVIVVANFKQLAASKNVYEPIGKSYRKLHETLPTNELEILVRYFETSLELTRQEIIALQKNQATK